MKYTRKFDTVSAYESAELDYPNMSYIVEDDSIRLAKTAPPHDYSQDYLTFVALEDGTFKFSGNSVNYSLDNGETWTTLASNTDSPTVQSGGTIMWKGTLTPGFSGIGGFSSTGRYEAQGNPMSLIFGDNFSSQTSLSGKNNAFKALFKGSTGLTSAGNLSLPATTLANDCYSSMFTNCTSLTTAPELPATTLTNNCYQNMFIGCTSLTTAPTLPAATLAQYCYNAMFYNCSSLTTAPPTLPATTLTNNCYENMFRGCTSLTTAPELPATTLAQYCYNAMFMGCTSLTTAPSLPATTLTPYCYSYMFQGCTNINSITCLATDISAFNCTAFWLSGVAASGTFTKAASMTSWTTGINGIPSNWTVQDAS